MIDDDRNLIQPGDPVLLIVEDDVTFARILVDLAHDRGIKALVALRGSTRADAGARVQARRHHAGYQPARHGGWTILDRLKHDPATRHIPVHVISGDENRRRGLALGAMTYLEKSVTKDILNEAFDAIRTFARSSAPRSCCWSSRTTNAARTHGANSLGGDDLEIFAVATGGEALAVVEAAVPGRHRDRSASGRTFRPSQLVEEIQAETGPHVAAHRAVRHAAL